jgi:MFS superfamily sulfate permease-like transporter
MSPGKFRGDLFGGFTAAVVALPLAPAFGAASGADAVAGLFGAIPGAGAGMRTVINVRAGGDSRLSGVFNALVLLCVVLGFGELAARIPTAVLGGMLIKVGIEIIDWRYIRRIRTAPVAGVVIMLTTLVLTVSVDQVIACGLRDEVRKVVQKFEVLRLLPPNLIVPDRRAALRVAETLLNSDRGGRRA